MGKSRDSVADGISLRKSTVSVFDPYGVLPLNLPRTNLAKDLPFKIQLLNSQCEVS